MAPHCLEHRGLRESKYSIIRKLAEFAEQVRVWNSHSGILYGAQIADFSL
jgi:hypothetical protein